MSEVEEEDKVDSAFKVIEALVEAMDKVAAKPEISTYFIGELVVKMPDVVDALMVITKEEYRQKMAELVRASMRMAGAWVKKYGKAQR